MYARRALWGLLLLACSDPVEEGPLDAYRQINLDASTRPPPDAADRPRDAAPARDGAPPDAAPEDARLPADRPRVEDAEAPVDIARDAAPPVEDAAPSPDLAPLVDAAPPIDAVPPIDAAPPPQEGTWEAPFIIEVFPSVLEGDTAAARGDLADRYTPCAPDTAEDGPEIVYALEIPYGGLLRLSLDDTPGDDIDNDLHLLDAPSPDACLARDNIQLSQRVEVGERYWISVDGWFNGQVARSGPYALTVELIALDPGDCPEGSLPVWGYDGAPVCMDRYEAPNREGALPLVMYTFDQAEAWCGRRGKRLCFDDEWTAACEGEAGAAYPYGDDHRAGICRDEMTWLQYDAALIGDWPRGIATPEIESLDALLAAARAAGGQASADHIEWLYQAAGSGEYSGCVNEHGIYDLVGNIEEWARRRDGGEPSFHGYLKGRYWAEARTCQQAVTTHGDAFRFYEVGFRCCFEP